jgi:hypothetical protein
VSLGLSGCWTRPQPADQHQHPRSCTRSPISCGTQVGLPGGGRRPTNGDVPGQRAHQRRGSTSHAFEVCRWSFGHRRRRPGLHRWISSRRLRTRTNGGERDYDATSEDHPAGGLRVTFALLRRTEGWAVGLYLAALYLREGGSLPYAAASLGGSDLFVREYLELELLVRISAGQRVFLTRAAVLERMNGSLCEAALDLPGWRDASRAGPVEPAAGAAGSPRGVVPLSPLVPRHASGRPAGTRWL